MVGIIFACCKNRWIHILELQLLDCSGWNFLLCGVCENSGWTRFIGLCGSSNKLCKITHFKSWKLCSVLHQFLIFKICWQEGNMFYMISFTWTFFMHSALIFIWYVLHIKTTLLIAQLDCPLYWVLLKLHWRSAEVDLCMQSEEQGNSGVQLFWWSTSF